MGEGYSIHTYFRWTVSVPVGVGVIVSTLILLALIIVSFFTFGKRRKNTSHLTHLTSFFFMCSKIVYRDALKKKKAPHRVLFHGYPIGHWHMVQCASIILVVILTVFLTFWASFLTESTFVCSPHLDCFFTNSSPLWIVGVDLPQRVESCAEVRENNTVICYQFAFSMTKGFSSSVGFLAVSVIYTYMYGYVLIWFMELVLSPRVTNCAIKLYSIIGWMCLIILPLLIGITMLVVIFCDAFLGRIAFKSFESGLTFLVYWCFFLYAGPVTAIFISFALWKSVKAEMYRDYNQLSNTQVNKSQEDIEEQPLSDEQVRDDEKHLVDNRPNNRYQSLTTSQTNF